MDMIVRFAWLACVLAVGCSGGDDAADRAAAQAPSWSTAPALPGSDPQIEGSERTWVGLLPCSDCKGIDTRLELRFARGRRDYLLTENYLGDHGTATFQRRGGWTEASEVVDGEPQVLYILDPEQGGQRYSLQPDGALELLDGNGREPSQAVAYRLQRL